MSTSSTSNEEFYNAEAHALFKRLNLDPSKRETDGGAWGYNSLDPIWRHPTTGGTIFVGNEEAARNLPGMTSRGISSVVNCTHGVYAIPCFHRGKVNYYVFEISEWGRHVGDTDDGMRRFVDPMFSFIDKALEKGESVLVHCLAGAHRAGTTGVACLMHYGGIKDVKEAILTGKSLRRAIDPIGRLPEFLYRLQRIEAGREGGGGGK